jgi:hypothetical protein
MKIFSERAREISERNRVRESYLQLEQSDERGRAIEQERCSSSDCDSRLRKSDSES